MSGTLIDKIEVPWKAVPVYKLNGGDEAQVTLPDLPVEAVPQVSSDKKSWATSRLIDTASFLQACRGLNVVFDAIGSAALDKTVKSDIETNVEKLNTRFKAHPQKSRSIQELCVNEIKDGEFRATEGFVWLVRTLNFTVKALKRSLENEKEELSDSFKNAYQDTLSKIHNLIMRGVAMTAWSIVPYRADFYRKLGDDQKAVKEELSAYLEHMERAVDILRAFIESEPAIIPKKFKSF